MALVPDPCSRIEAGIAVEDKDLGDLALPCPVADWLR